MLAERFGRVGIISGRPLEFLDTIGFSDTVARIGLYGLEQRVDGVRIEHVEAPTWRQTIADAVARADADGLHGMRVEDKGLSLTLHYRGRSEVADAVAAWAAMVGSDTGLHVRPARMSVELHPPIDCDKGSTLTEFIAGSNAAAFFGDDLGDLPAFDALDRFEADGGVALRVAVAGSDESPSELVDRADAVVDGPAGALQLLQSLIV